MGESNCGWVGVVVGVCVQTEIDKFMIGDNPACLLPKSNPVPVPVWMKQAKDFRVWGGLGMDALSPFPTKREREQRTVVPLLLLLLEGEREMFFTHSHTHTRPPHQLAWALRHSSLCSRDRAPISSSLICFWLAG